MARKKRGSVKDTDTIVVTNVDLASADVTGVLAVANGGTGSGSYTNGQLLIGNTSGNALVKATLTGTANQVVVTNGAGTITLSTPQDIGTSSSVQFGALNVSGNTIFGTSTGNTITWNADTWAAPTSIVTTKTAETGVAEEIARWKVSDSTSYVRLVNGTSNASQFAPTFESFIEAGVASTALSFSGTKGVSTTPGNPAILYVTRYNSGGGNTDIPDGGIAVEWRNRATPMVYVYGSGSLLLVKSGAGLGYGAGAGGTVTQGSGSGKATGCTLNKATGQITMDGATLNAATTVSFTFTNAVIAATDIMVMNHVSGGTAGAYMLNAQCGGGSASINVRNVTGGNLSEAIVIGFVVIKAVTS